METFSVWAFLLIFLCFNNMALIFCLKFRNISPYLHAAFFVLFDQESNLQKISTPLEWIWHPRLNCCHLTSHFTLIPDQLDLKSGYVDMLTQSLLKWKKKSWIFAINTFLCGASKTNIFMDSGFFGCSFGAIDRVSIEYTTYIYPVIVASQNTPARLRTHS